MKAFPQKILDAREKAAPAAEVKALLAALNKTAGLEFPAEENGFTDELMRFLEGVEKELKEYLN